MTNAVAGAKLDIEPKNCQLKDVEICEKGVNVISEVNEDGETSLYKENDYNESYPAYYYCQGCERDWTINKSDPFKPWQSQEQAWALVKEHLAWTV